MRGRLRSVVEAGIIASLGLSCGSCSPGFLIETSGFGPNIRLEFSQGGIFGASTMNACVSGLTVMEAKWPTRASGAVVWEIIAPKGCITLTGLDVGHVPIGFVEKVNRLPLKVGNMYDAEADADPFSGHSMAWFVCKANPATARWKDQYRLEDPPKSCSR